MARSVRISVEDARALTTLAIEPAELREKERAYDRLVAALARLDRSPPSGLRQAGRKANPEMLAKARTLKARANETRSAFGLAPLVSKPRRPTKAEKRDETAAIREACLERAGGLCECGCGYGLYPANARSSPPLGHFAAPELDHFFGRGKGRPPQSVETCWILRADCHREKTDNRPDSATWLRKFITHCERQMATTDDLGRGQALYLALCEARRRLAFVETRSALPAAPMVGP